tara:strand:- start:1119 stop:2384 length:1266 start_codon:yes stop_codon:yes gene_type:complete
MKRFGSVLLAAGLLASAAPVRAQTLDAAIRDALAYSPAIEEASAEQKAAQSLLGSARAEGNPLLRVEGSVGTGRIDPQGFFGLSADDTTPLALKATAEMPLYAGGRTAAAIGRAKDGVEIARLQAEQARLQTVVATVSAYANLLSSRQIEARSRKLVAQLTETQRQAKLRFQSGDIPSSEVALARARKAEADAGLAQAEGRRMSAEARYRRITGKPAGELAPLPPLPMLPATLDEAVDRARASNPMLLQSQAAISAAHAGVRVAKAEGMPVIGIFTEAARVRDQFFPDYRANSATVGVRGQWTLWAGGRVASQVQQADAALSATHAQARATQLEVDGMAIDGWQAVQTARQMLSAARARSEASAEALRSTQLEAQVGEKPTLALLDAERDALEAEAGLIEAEGAQLVAAYTLRAIMGVAIP